MTYYTINGAWKSQDDRIMIRREFEETSYYKGGKRYYKKKKDKIYVVTVDGKELPFAESRLKDAKEMALKQIRKNNQAKKAQMEVNDNGSLRCSESADTSIE